MARRVLARCGKLGVDSLDVSTVKRARTHATLAAVGLSGWCVYSGMLPCFLGGMASLLFRSIDKVRIKRGLVSRASMTSST